jgi:hypothetical protein
MAKITKLTTEQIGRFEEWSKQWIDVGLSTEPADFDKATEAALRGYQLANLKRPMVILRMSSPYGACIGGALAWAMLRELGDKKVGSQVESQVRSQVESQVGSQVESQVRSQVESQVRSQVVSQVGSQVRSQVGSQVGSQVVSQVRSQVRSQVGSQVGSQVVSQVRSQVVSQVGSQVVSQVESQVGSQVESQVGSQVESQVGSSYNNLYNGAFWASWGAYVSFFRDVCGWQDPILDRFGIDEALVKNCGWVWWHENVLAISDRPQLIKRDDQGRLHNEAGPSIAYRDGWALHHWHGTSIPREWIEDKSKLTPAIALGASNIERRRAACEMLGWERILGELKAKTIDKDADPQIGELVEVKLPGEGRQKITARYLRVQCGTGRKFAVGVPPTINTAIEAQSWMQGLSPDEFRVPEVRT